MKAAYRWGLVAAFRPVLMESSETLEKEAAGYYNLITSSELEENLRATLQDVFVSWLEHRFTDKSKQEIEILLLGALPESTKCDGDRCSLIPLAESIVACASA